MIRTICASLIGVLSISSTANAVNSCSTIFGSRSPFFSVVKKTTLPYHLGEEAVYHARNGYTITRFKLRSEVLRDEALNMRLFRDSAHRYDTFSRESLYRQRDAKQRSNPLISILTCTKAQSTDGRTTFTFRHPEDWAKIVRRAGFEIEVEVGPAFISNIAVTLRNAEKFTVPHATSTGYAVHDAFGHRLGYLGMPPIFQHALKEIAKVDRLLINDPVSQRLLKKYGEEKLEGYFDLSSDLLENFTDDFDPFQPREAFSRYENFIRNMNRVKFDRDFAQQNGIQISADEVDHLNRLIQVPMDPVVVAALREIEISSSAQMQLFNDQVHMLQVLGTKMRSSMIETEDVEP